MSTGNFWGSGAGLWTAIESVSPHAFLLTLFWDHDNDDVWDGQEEDPAQDTIWMYTF